MMGADRSGSRLALLIGSDELAVGVVTVRPLRAAGDQTTLPRVTVATGVAKCQEVNNRQQ